MFGPRLVALSWEMPHISGGEIQLEEVGPWVSTGCSALMVPGCSDVKNGLHQGLHHCDVLAKQGLSAHGPDPLKQ